MVSIQDMLNKNIIYFGLIMIVVSLLRFVPHPPNMTPVIAVSILAVTWFKRPVFQFGFPLLIMLLTDMVIGFHWLMPVVYLSIMCAGLTGFILKKRSSFSTILGSGLVSSIIFFMITNFGVWVVSSMYPKTVLGLMSCYVAAIPFFHNTVIATVGVLFGVFGLNYAIKRWFQPSFVFTEL